MMYDYANARFAIVNFFEKELSFGRIGSILIMYALFAVRRKKLEEENAVIFVVASKEVQYE